MRLAALVWLAFGVLNAQSKPPKLLTEAVRTLPGLTILDPKIDFQGDRLIEQLKSIPNYPVPSFPSWVENDFDHDGLTDVVAAVTAREKTGRRFGLLAVNSRTPKNIIWIQSLGPQVLYGVDFYRINGVASKERIEILTCIACDATGWVRWSGNAYELELYSVRDHLIAVPSDLFAEPNINAHVLKKSATCTRIRMIDYRGSEWQKRWYLVEMLGSKLMRGWIPASSVMEDTSCDSVF